MDAYPSQNSGSVDYFTSTSQGQSDYKFGGFQRKQAEPAKTYSKYNEDEPEVYPTSTQPMKSLSNLLEPSVTKVASQKVQIQVKQPQQQDFFSFETTPQDSPVQPSNDFFDFG